MTTEFHHPIFYHRRFSKVLVLPDFTGEIDALEFMVLAGQDQLWVPEMHCLCVDVLRHLAAGTGS
jgi:hypothetical protein